MENTVIVNYAGGYMSYRINRQVDGTATVDRLQVTEEGWKFGTGAMEEDNSFPERQFPSPREALMWVAGELGW